MPFRNSSYFDAEAPQKLLKNSEVLDGAWFEADGMSNWGGGFPMPRSLSRFPHATGWSRKIEYGSFEHKTTWAVLGAVGSRT